MSEKQLHELLYDFVFSVDAYWRCYANRKVIAKKIRVAESDRHKRYWNTELTNAERSLMVLAVEILRGVRPLAEALESHGYSSAPRDVAVEHNFIIR